jgi:Transglycosylase SLT domain
MDPVTVATTMALLLGEPPAVAPSGRPAQADETRVSPDGTAQWNAEITEGARRFGLPESWIRAVMIAESAGVPSAVSPKGAMGLMQLMPETWRAMRAAYGLGDDAFDPRDNIMAGAAFLKALYDRFGIPDFLAAYNAGPKAMQDILSGLRPMPDESRIFMAKVGASLGLPGSGNAGASATAAPADKPRGLFFSTASTRPHEGANLPWRQLFAPLGRGGGVSDSGR